VAGTDRADRSGGTLSYPLGVGRAEPGPGHQHDRVEDPGDGEADEGPQRRVQRPPRPEVVREALSDRGGLAEPALRLRVGEQVVLGLGEDPPPPVAAHPAAAQLGA
jgi:hypothetical protein